jgi:GT2 family glycosyltransferase
MSVVAVVLTYNRQELLMRCLDGILHQTRPVDRIILVDNGSNDGTVEALQRSRYFASERLHFVRLEDNVGSSGGLSTALKAAYDQGYEWIWLMDDDAIPTSSALEKLWQYAEEHKAEKLGGLVSFQKAWKHGAPKYRLPRSIGEALRYYVACPLDFGETAPAVIPLDWSTFVSIPLPRAVICDVGLPRQDFYLYCEDIDYTMRIRKAGYQLLLVKDSLVDHLQGIEVNKKSSMGSEIRWYYNYRNHIANIIIHRKDLGESRAVAALARISLGAMWRVARAYRHKNYDLSRLVLRAIKDGYSLNLGKYR